MFNPVNVDVFVKYKLSENFQTQEYESGWNIIPQENIPNLLLVQRAKNIKFHKFNISVDLAQNSEDTFRSWTAKMGNGTRQIVNGKCLKQPQFILEADIKDF